LRAPFQLKPREFLDFLLCLDSCQKRHDTLCFLRVGFGMGLGILSFFFFIKKNFNLYIYIYEKREVLHKIWEKNEIKKKEKKKKEKKRKRKNRSLCKLL
jgi:hypothetical protein